MLIIKRYNQSGCVNGFAVRTFDVGQENEYLDKFNIWYIFYT